MQVNLDPAGRGRDVLSVVFGAPALDEAHSYRAHLGQLVDGLEAVVDGLGQELGKLLVVEDLEGAAGRDFAHGAGVESVVVVAVAALHEDGRVGQALGVDLATDVIQVHSLSDMTTCVFDCTVAVDVAQLAQTEAVRVVRGVGEPVHDDRRRVAVEHFANAAVQLVVSYTGPIRRFLVADRGHLAVHLICVHLVVFLACHVVPVFWGTVRRRGSLWQRPVRALRI